MKKTINKTYRKDCMIIEITIYDNTYRKIGYYKTDEYNFYKILKMIYKKFGIITIQPKDKERKNKDLEWLDTPPNW